MQDNSIKRMARMLAESDGVEFEICTEMMGNILNDRVRKQASEQLDKLGRSKP